jgi:hypothetical protein
MMENVLEMILALSAGCIARMGLFQETFLSR